MQLLEHMIAAMIGFVLIASFLRSAAHVALLNRRSRDGIAYHAGRLVHRALAARALKRSDFPAVQDTLAWALPSYVLLLICIWFALVQVGFSLLIWSVHAEPGVLQATIASGSALSTLGFQTPATLPGQFLAIAEGAMGLGIIVFYFTFIPGLQAAIQSRQAKVAWLYARADTGLSNFTVLDWFASCERSDWIAVWGEWEAWFRNLAETHVLTPVLAFVPTVHRGETWIVASAVALDSAALYIAAVEAGGHEPAKVCFKTGVGALRLIAAELANCPAIPQSFPQAPLTRQHFDDACHRLCAHGTRINANADSNWARFVMLRGEYENLVLQLAQSLFVPTSSRILAPLASAATITQANSFNISVAA